ncbi:hypothetical protein [Bacteriophage sp.]|nr:hypothetical protein [Bacteriophage sp.]
MTDLLLKIKGENSSGVKALKDTQNAAQETAQAVVSAVQAVDRSANVAEGNLKNLRNSLAAVASDLKEQTGKISQSIDEQAGAISRGFERGRPATRQAFKGIADDASASANIAREAFQTGASEIIESWGVDGDIANELAKVFTKMPTGAKVAIGGVVAAFAAGAIGIGLFVATAERVLDISEKIGTRSKEDFKKFKEELGAAGVQVTQLDRNLAQQLDKSANKVKATLDGLFLVVLREAGPDFIRFLNQLSGALNDSKGIAVSLGNALADAFRTAADWIFVARQEAEFFTSQSFLQSLDYLRRLFSSDPGERLSLLSEQAQRFTEGVISGRIKRPNEDDPRNTPATFDGGNARKNQINQELELLRVREQTIQRLSDEELANAKRLFDAKAITAEQYATRQLAAERRVLTARLATNQAEQEAITRGSNSQAEKNVKLAQLKEEEAKLLSDYNEQAKRIREAQGRDEIETINRTLDNARKAAEARLRFQQELQQIALDVRAQRLDVRQIALERNQAVPGGERREIEQQRQIDEEKARLQSERQQAQIQAQIAELEFADLTYQQKIELERAYNQELKAERVRLAEELAQIAIESRAQELSLLGGFSPEQAAAIAEFEAGIERQATAWEKARVAASAYARTLQTEASVAMARATNIVGVFQSAVVAGVNAFVQSGFSLKAAGKAIAVALAEPFIKAAQTKAAYHAAEAVASLAVFDLRGAALHGLAAAGFAALAGVGQALISGGGGGAGAIGGGAYGNELTGTNQNNNQPQETRFINSERDRDGRTATNVIITLKTEPGQFVQNVEKALVTSFGNDGAARRIIRNEVNGEPLSA